MRSGLRAELRPRRPPENSHVQFLWLRRHQRKPGISGAGLKSKRFICREIPTDVNLRELHFSIPERYPFLLQSTAIDSSNGRFDILFAFPGKSIVADREDLTCRFLEKLDAHWNNDREEVIESDLPFHGGWFVYLGYEMAAEIEPTLNLAEDPALPRAFAVRCKSALIRDHSLRKTYALSETSKESHIEIILKDIGEAAVGQQNGGSIGSAALQIQEEQPERFLSAVDDAKRYIVAGDIFQANLSRSWRTVTDLAPRSVYSRLATANPAPFAGSVKWRNHWILSSSPERLLRIRDGIASTRPIAGTRPRGAVHEEDMVLSAELFAHPKERAEHIMLIDLERNDLGRICEFGSVEVDEMMVLESYAHVHHIVSNVKGRLRQGVTPGTALRAVFPGGTITGCPKVRCMQIIAELENCPRGAYTGSFGYLNRDGSLDLNILIRTLVMDGASLHLRAGAGIVADSEPAAELAETRAKARGLLVALQ